MIPQIEPIELFRRVAEGKVSSGELALLDVRQPEEFELVRIDGSVLIPLMEIESRLSDIKALAAACPGELVVLCRVGGRSEMAINFLAAAGVPRLVNLRGGINAYAREADTSLSPY